LLSNFSNLHPAWHLIYYSLALGLVFFTDHPLSLILVWLGMVWSLELHRYFNKEQDFGQSLRLYAMPFILSLLMGFINMLLRDYGIYPLIHFSSGRTWTLDAFLEGFVGAFRLGLSLMVFSHLGRVLNMNGLLYLLKPLFPGFALLLSLVFKFFPRFRHEARELRLVQTSNRPQSPQEDLPKMPMKVQAREMSIFLSTLSGWALEDSIESAKLMQQRGYGLDIKPTSYKLYRWTIKESLLLFALVPALLGPILSVRYLPVLVSYQPYLYLAPLSPLRFLLLALPALLYFLPGIIDLRTY
jgi:energy-coupling factor transport system permease protein